MSRFFTAIVAILFLPCSAKAGILINPVVSVSSDTTNPLATITISLYAGSDSGTPQNVNSYTVDALLTNITPALTSVTLNSPSVVTGSNWSATNFTTATSAGIISGNAGFRFSGSRSGSNISMPQVVSGNSNFLLGTATLTAARPGIGSGAVSYSLDLATYTFTSDPSAPVTATDNSFGFSIAAQTAAAVPEPASALVLLGGAAGLGWRRLRTRNR
jgi:hypothetical protein